MVEVSGKKWFVSRTRARQEKKIKFRLEELGVETFIPLRTEYHVYRNGRRKKVDVPLLPNLMFVRVDPEERFALLSRMGNLWMQYVIDRFTHSSMIVPDKQLYDFIKLVESRDRSLETESPDLHKGDRVRVVEGELQGIEGECMELRGKKRVVLRLESLLAVSVEIPLQYLEKI